MSPVPISFRHHAAHSPRILVTGAGGFVGRACLPLLLNQGAEVVGTFRGKAAPHGPEGVRWVRLDLLEAAETARRMAELRPTHLLALGWHMGPGNLDAQENFLWLARSVELLRAFASQGGQRVVFCGSCMEYDWTGGAALLREGGTPLRPATAYGAAKAALATAYGPLCRSLGLSGAWARPFFLYGPGESRRRLAAGVITALLEGREAPCSHGRQRRDFLHVQDVAEAMVRLVSSDLTGAMNIGSGEGTALADLVGEIGRQTGRGDLVRLGALPARPGEAPVVVADTTRLRGELGWRPRFDLQTGIADTIRWWTGQLVKEV